MGFNCPFGDRQKDYQRDLPDTLSIGSIIVFIDDVPEGGPNLRDQNVYI